MFPRDHTENGSFIQIIDDGLPNLNFISTFLIFFLMLDNEYIHRGTVILSILYKI